MAKIDQIFLRTLSFGRYISVFYQKISDLKRYGEICLGDLLHRGYFAIIDDYG